jgi:propanediol dehydratase large subunit
MSLTIKLHDSTKHTFSDVSDDAVHAMQIATSAKQGLKVEADETARSILKMHHKDARPMLCDTARLLTCQSAVVNDDGTPNWRKRNAALTAAMKFYRAAR